MHTLTFTTATARDLQKARRAIAATDKEKDNWERREDIDPNVATLQITGDANLTLPIRCDILARWTAAYKDVDTFRMTVDPDSLAVTVSPVPKNCLRSVGTIKLLAPAFPAGVLPFIARMSAEFGSCEIIPDFDTKTACLSARSLRAAKAEAKAEGQRARELAEENKARAEYLEAVALLTPANIGKAIKETCSLRKLKAWARRLAPILDTASALPEPSAIASLRELDPLDIDSTSYAQKFEEYLAAKTRHDNYKPRGYFNASKERPRRAKDMNYAAGIARDCLQFAARQHVEQFGPFYIWHVAVGAYNHSISARVNAARKTVRKYRAGIAEAFLNG